MNEIIKCIFCLKNKRSSLEHIFPDSLGGILTTKDVCKECNDYMGRIIDSPLINNFLMDLIRLTYKLEGKGGKVPNPFAKGQLEDDFPGEVHYKMNGKGEPQKLYAVPKKLVESSNEKTEVKISVDVSDKAKLVKMVNGELLKHGKRPMTAEEVFALSTTKLTPQPKISMKKEMNLYGYQKAILKIIYEVTYHFLGKKYLDDPIALKIRDVLKDKSKGIKKVNLIGKIKITSEEDIEKDQLSSCRWMANKESITAALINTGNQIYCYVNLFCTFEGGFIVSKIPEEYGIKSLNGLVIENNVVTKTLKELSFAEKVKEMNN